MLALKKFQRNRHFERYKEGETVQDDYNDGGVFSDI